MSADGVPGICVQSNSDNDLFLAIDSEQVETASVSPPSAPIGDIPKLHSHATAAQKIYLDFTGQIVHSTGWNELNRGQAIHAPAFDMDGNTKSFSATEVQVIEEVWARVAEDFAPFELDVTTEAPSVRSMRAGSEAIRVLITTNVDSASGRRWFSEGSGVAYMNSWRYESDTPVWVFANKLGARAKHIAESVSHEVGHAFGLQHDGIGDSTGEDEEYYYGHGDEQTGWAPILGIGYSRPVTQWNSGEYAASSNSQDDIATIASESNDVRIRVDDHPDQFASARRIETGIAGQANQTGLISTRDDRDLFRLDIASGAINVMVSGAVGSNLDIEAKLFDAYGGVIGTFGTEDSLSVSVQANVSRGTYFLGIDGVGRGDPSSDGYSDYGSLGQYTISGELPRFTESTSQAISALNSDYGYTIIVALRAQARRYIESETTNEEESNTTAKAWQSIVPQTKALSFARAAARRIRARFN